MIDLIVIPVILAGVALFVLSLICSLLSLARSEDLRERIEHLIHENCPDIQIGKIPRGRAMGRLDMTCDHAFEYAKTRKLFAERADLSAEYWRLRSFRNWSMLGMLTSAICLMLAASF